MGVLKTQTIHLTSCVVGAHSEPFQIRLTNIVTWPFNILGRTSSGYSLSHDSLAIDVCSVGGDGVEIGPDGSLQVLVKGKVVYTSPPGTVPGPGSAPAPLDDLHSPKVMYPH